MAQKNKASATATASAFAASAAAAAAVLVAYGSKRSSLPPVARKQERLLAMSYKRINETRRLGRTVGTHIAAAAVAAAVVVVAAAAAEPVACEKKKREQSLPL